MNFKRNLLIISALIGSVFAVAGCVDKKAFVRYEFIEETTDSHEDEVFANGAYEKCGDYKTYKAIGYNGKDTDLGDSYSVMTKYANKSIMRATGEQKILVIPVEFEDFQIVKHLNISLTEYLNNLNKAFFGVAKNNSFVSVSEYYNRSSYGKLKLSGKVCEKVYQFPESIYSITSRKSDSSDLKKLVLNCYDNVINWYKNQVADDIDTFRIDGTGDVAIYLVYDYPTDMNVDNSSFFWAYTFSDKPLSWSSYLSLNALNDEPDAHTFIHETGHLLGLVDYYPDTNTTDKDSKPTEPTGRIDMMDCSVGDHTGLSKMLLNWARPYQVKDSCEITLRSLVNYGDLILINNTWNGTVFDEYYLLEFYSPTGLNYFDVNNGNNLVKLPNMPGLKLYHVDARLGYYKKEEPANLRAEPKFAKYCDSYGGCYNVAKIDFARDNTSFYKRNADNVDTKNYLYELVLNNLGHAISGAATNYHLYREGNTIESLIFDSDRQTNYKITVTGMTYRDATIKFEKLN